MTYLPYLHERTWHTSAMAGSIIAVVVCCIIILPTAFFGCQESEPEPVVKQTTPTIVEEPASTQRLAQLGISYVRSDTGLVVMIEDVRPVAYVHRGGISPVLGVTLSTDGVHLVMKTPSEYRRVPLVDSGQLLIKNTQLVHFPNKVRVVIDIAYLKEER